MGRVKGSGEGAGRERREEEEEEEEEEYFFSPPPFPSFALAPTQRGTISTLPDRPLS